MESDPMALGDHVVEKMNDSPLPALRMADQSIPVPSNDAFDKHRRLIDWVLANDGFLHPEAQIAFSPRKGFHAIVMEGKTLASGTRVASCPLPVTLSVMNALQTRPFSNHGTSFPKAFLRNQISTPEALQAFFLMEQLVLGEKSWWAPYIATIPSVEDVNEMQFEDEADLRWLEGTNLKAGLSTQTAKWNKMYQKGMSQLMDMNWPNAVDGSYTWPRFRWAATIFGSRSFTSQVLDATLPADLARLRHQPQDCDVYDLVKLFSERFAVLLPLLDLLNHKPGAQVEWQARSAFVGLQILETYKSGQELCNNYGPRDNEGLLMAYGFTIQNNPFDHLVISLRVPPGSPLEIARSWKPDWRSDPEKRCFLFDYRHPESTDAVAIEVSIFSFDLLDSISVLSANERELQAMFARKQTLMSYSLSDQPKFQDGRLILATLSQLLRECSVRVERLAASDPARMNPATKPQNAKQQNAKVYRDSQLDIVETAVAVCTFVLRSATIESTKYEVLDGLRGKFSSSAYQNLQELVKRHRRLTRPFELLSPDAMLEMLSTELSESLRKFLSDMESNRQPNNDATTRGPTTLCDKSRLALMLSALYSEYTHGVKLPQRITEWIEQLTEWYPLDPETWAYVPTSGPWAPGEEPPTELVDLLSVGAAMSPVLAESSFKRWLRPERICWGWNIMEEEKVLIPQSVLASSNEEGEGNQEDANAVFIYWQQY